MSVYQRNGFWHTSITINGKRIRKAIREASTRRQAERAERVIRDEIFENRYGIGGQKVFETFVEESYKPYAKEHKKGYGVELSVLKVLTEKFGKMKLCEITTEEVEKFKRKRASETTSRGETRSKATVNRDIAVLSAVFNLAKKYDQIKENPIKGKITYYSKLKSRSRILLDDEEKTLFEFIKDDVKFSRQIEILLYTGMRRGELFKIEWRDIDFVNNCINLREEITKTQKPRQIHLFFNIRAIFEQLKNETDNFNPNDKVFVGNPSQPNQFTFKFREVADKLGFTDLNVHSLRHTFSTRANKYNVDVFAQKAILGHSKLSMTDKYTHISLETVRNSLFEFEQQVRHTKATINNSENVNPSKPLHLLEFKRNR